jgi:hypothetical protein
MHTTHGSHIPGTKLGNNPPVRFPRCGGVTSCPDCALEAESVFKTREFKIYGDGDEAVQVEHEFVDYRREEYYDEQTLMRVYQAICEAGADDELARRVINVMTSHGIVFREKRNTQ